MTPARHAQGRDERGAARLGDQCRRHLLHHRHRRRPAPLPAMVRDFQSVIGTEAKEQMMARKAVCPTRWWPASAAAPTPWGCSIPSSTTRTCASSASRPAGMGSRRRSTQPPDRRHARRAARQPHLPAAGRRRTDHRGPFDFGRTGLSRASARSIPGCRTAGGSNMSTPRTRRRWNASSSARSSRASFPRWNPRTRSPMSPKIAPKLPKDHIMS